MSRRVGRLIFNYTLAFYIIAGTMIASAVVAFVVRPKAPSEERTATTPEGTAPVGSSGG